MRHSGLFVAFAQPYAKEMLHKSYWGRVFVGLVLGIVAVSQQVI